MLVIHCGMALYWLSEYFLLSAGLMLIGMSENIDKLEVEGMALGRACDEKIN